MYIYTHNNLRQNEHIMKISDIKSFKIILYRKYLIHKQVKRWAEM